MRFYAFVNSVVRNVFYKTADCLVDFLNALCLCPVSPARKQRQCEKGKNGYLFHISISSVLLILLLPETQTLFRSKENPHENGFPCRHRRCPIQAPRL